METKKENNEFLPLKIIGIIILLVIIGYFVFNNSSQNSNNTTSTILPTTLSNEEICKQYAQKAADVSNNANSTYSSVQSYHYSNIDDTCYFEIHYQFSVKGFSTSQVYTLKAQSISLIKGLTAGMMEGFSIDEASCIVSEIYYDGSTKTNCTYYGLIFSKQPKYNYTIIENKNSLVGDNTVPMSYSDYKALVQRRMSN